MELSQCPTIGNVDNLMQIFGAFLSAEMSERRNGLKLSFFGTGETFLFQIAPGIPLKYGWVGADGATVAARNTEMFVAADNTTLIIGGGYDCPHNRDKHLSDLDWQNFLLFSNGEGICIRDSLDVGITQSCATFDNPPLVSSGRFQIAGLEVFRFAGADEWVKENLSVNLIMFLSFS